MEQIERTIKITESELYTIELLVEWAKDYEPTKHATALEKLVQAFSINLLMFILCTQISLKLKLIYSDYEHIQAGLYLFAIPALINLALDYNRNYSLNKRKKEFLGELQKFITHLKTKLEKE